MKIAIIVNSLEKKGPVIVAIELAKKLSAKFNNVDVIYLKNKGNAFKHHNINYIKFSSQTFFSLYEYDVVHSHSLLPDMINALSCLYTWRRKRNANTVSTIHNNIFSDLNNEYGFLKANIMKLAWMLSWTLIQTKVCISKSMLSSYDQLNVFKTGKWTYVYNTVERPMLSEASVKDIKQIDILKKLKENGKKIIGSCAVITERKGLQYLINSARNLSDDYIVIIVGDGPYKQHLNKIINDNNIQNVILFDKTNEVHAYMRLIDIYAMPSISEGFGLAAIEAIQTGCKLICSRINTFKELFGDNCLYFDLDNNLELVEAIMKADAFNYTELRKIVDEKFNAEQFVKGYLKAYLDD
ncbi:MULTISPECIES: glycosyltransferase family 4 protein [Enterobacter]|uniref:glycosyltransferase family 4 protein n=1 Tax=Enterobacter TaxID=547 RepID=UPI00254BAA10|nr:glycosyltransferase family 4 protein [Enterobacter sp. MEB024]